jgi:hypothetical protein
MPFTGGDPVALARSIVEANRYLTLATADQDGLPWASPVWFASADFREFFWVSSPDAQHLSARAELVPEPDLDRGIATFSLASQAQGGRAWGCADVQEPARHRLYRATAVTSYVLSETDERVLVDLA